MDPGMVLYEMKVYDHILALIICILAPILAFTSRRISTEEIELTSDDKIRLYHGNGLLLIVFAIIVVTVWRLPGRAIQGLGIDFIHPSPYLLIIILLIFLFYFLDIYFQYGSKKLRERTIERRNKGLSFIPANGKELFHFMFLAIAAGIGEEIIFRGYLINYLLHWTGNDMTGVLIACFFSSSLFALLHVYQGPVSIIKIFFLALLFSAIFVLTHSLLIIVLIHIVIDILSGIVGIMVLRRANSDSDSYRE
jgi:membrane protease YdiL (CAAX protease family)